jgi:hypothetical protein
VFGVRFVLAACVVLLVPGGAARSSALSVGVAGLSTRAMSAAVLWHSNAPARVTVEVGLTDEYGVWSRPAVGTQGRAVLAGLEPRTTYRYRVVAVSGPERAETAGWLTTGGLPPWTPGTTRPNALYLDWQPVFPRMVFQQCTWAFPQSLAAGIDLFMGAGCGESGQTLVDAAGGRAFTVVDAAERTRVDGRGLIGWYQVDEPDGKGMKDLPQLPPSSASRRASFVTLTNHFYSGAAPLPAGRTIYPQLISRAEMIGFDLYPLQSWCRRDALPAVYYAQRELVALAAGKPTFQWIESGPMSICRHHDPTGAVVRAEAWLAIAGGARGIGYFPDLWTKDVASAIVDVNRTIVGLSPALLGLEAPTSASSPVLAGARTYHGAAYVIAVNPTYKQAQASISLPGHASGTVSVYGEGRSLSISAGRVTDTFARLGVHIYVAAPTD